MTHLCFALINFSFILAIVSRAILCSVKSLLRSILISLILFLRERQAHVKLLALAPRNAFLVVSTKGMDRKWEEARNSPFWKEFYRLGLWKLLGERLADNIVLIEANYQGEIIAAVVGARPDQGRRK